jgi:hypothetical protein
MLLWVGYYVYRIRVRGRIRRMVDGDVDVKTLKGLGGRVDVVSECSGEYSMSSGRRRGLVGMWLGCSIRTTGEELMMPAVGRMFWRVGLAWRQMCVCVCACVCVRVSVPSRLVHSYRRNRKLQLNTLTGNLLNCNVAARRDAGRSRRLIFPSVRDNNRLLE